MALPTFGINIADCKPKMLYLSAYYSPQKGQAFYIHGTYDAEVKMNGQGTHGASGAPVYDGMVAASKQYPFGTVVVIPKIWNGIIEDRWWAIVSDPQGSQTGTEHIDIWVGKWTAGLMRALTFGRQQRKWYICSGQKTQEIGFNIHTLPSYKYFFDVTLWAQKMSKGRKDQRVESLQKYLWKLWYLRQEDIHGNYNHTTHTAVCKFQVKYNILSQNDPICGTFWPKTSFAVKKEAQVRGLLPDDLYTLTTLDPVIAYLPHDSDIQQSHNTGMVDIDISGVVKKESDSILPMIQDFTKLKGVKHLFYRYYKPGEHNTEIIFLQKFLQQNGYYHDSINGINSTQTKDALYQFQLNFDILKTDADPQIRGFLWPKTRKIINQTFVKS